MHGDEHADCADAYNEYAKALLKKVQSEGDPFGSAGPKPENKAPAAEGASSSSGAAAEGDAAGDEATGEGKGLSGSRYQDRGDE